MAQHPRREVRVAQAFFDQLDGQLGHERGPDGEPSATDFLVVDLPGIVDNIGAEFDTLPEAVGGVGAARLHIGAGALVRAVAVTAILIDDVIELIGIEIDQ